MQEIQCTEHKHYTVHVVCLESSETVGEKKWCHQLGNVIQELFGRLANLWQGIERSDITLIRGLVTYLEAWIRCFCPKQTGQPGNESKKDSKDKSEKKHKDHSKTCDSRVPQLIYSCVDLTRHLFIVCIYLLGNWVSPAVQERSAAHNMFFGAIGKKLKCVWFFFYFYHEEKKKKEKKSYAWTTVPFYQIGCVEKNIWCFQCIHTAFWLFACI